MGLFLVRGLYLSYGRGRVLDVPIPFLYPVLVHGPVLGHLVLCRVAQAETCTLQMPLRMTEKKNTVVLAVGQATPFSPYPVH
jgi:hypothetical protein